MWGQTRTTQWAADGRRRVRSIMLASLLAVPVRAFADDAGAAPDEASVSDAGAPAPAVSENIESTPVPPGPPLAREPAPPTEPTAPQSASDLTIQDLSVLSLEQLLNVQVVTAAKQSESASSAPAIISVVSADEIALWGYRSVAEALAYVPGLYPLFDFTSYNVGVRGINGGLGAYGRIIKVMIDGQPVSFRSSAANFLGPEFIAMEAIERIEVVRGPASALYGANAYLGVINIITRKPGQTPAAAINARGGSILEQSLGGLLSGRIEAGTKHVQAMVAASGGYLDRSGHRLPTSSPDYGMYESDGRLKSKKDVQKPRNAFMRVSSQLGQHELSLSGQYMTLDSHGEFLDFGQLSHDNRVVLKTGSAWLRDTYRPLENLTINASVAYARGRPGDAEHLSTGATNSYKRRAFGFDAVDASLEGQLTLAEIHNITLGADFTHDHERLMRVYNINTTTGAEVLEGGRNATRNFDNTGVYGQYRVLAFHGATASASARYDHHSIYGDQANYRAGWVHAVIPRFTYKLLFGTSFRAPTAVQLFGQSLYAGDARGNPDLKPEKARTLELGVEWHIIDELAVLATGCWIEAEHKVEVVPMGIINRPQNLGKQRSLCAEGEIKWLRAWSTVLATIAYANSKTWGLSSATLFSDTPDQRKGDLYPALNATLRWNIALARFGNLGLAVRYAAARRASASNVAENLGQSYSLAPYVLADAVYGLPLGRKDANGKQAHRIELSGRNLLDHRYAEPGFSGIDVPGRGRELWLGYRYQLQ